MMSSYNMKAFKKFFSREDIQQALGDNDIYYIYDEFFDVSNGYTSVLTSFLRDHDIEPIDYVSKVLRRCIYENSSIQEITIPSTLNIIAEYAFLDCCELYKVEIEEGVQQIRAHAFRNCHNLREVKIPRSVSLISDHAFDEYNDKLKFYCHRDSYAHKHFEEIEREYELID